MTISTMKAARTTGLAMVLAAALSAPLPGTDVRATSWPEMVRAATAICGAQLVAVRQLEVDDAGGSLALPGIEWRFRLIRSLVGRCDGEVMVRGRANDLLDRGGIASAWILLLDSGAADEAAGDASAPGEPRIVAWPRGALRLMTVRRLDYQGTAIEIVAPQSLLHLRDFPDELWTFEQLRMSYFANQAIDFGARVVRLDDLEGWIRRQPR